MKSKTPPGFESVQANGWLSRAVAAGLLVAAVSGCGGGGSSGGGGGGTTVPATYAYQSQFIANTSSVSYTGQNARQLSIEEINQYIGTLTTEIASTPGNFTSGQVNTELTERFENTNSADSRALRLTTTPALMQTSVAGLSTGKSLVGKIAGNDSVTDHKDWDNGGFVGWSDTGIAANGGGIDSPENLVRAFFARLNKLAEDRASNIIPQDPGGSNISEVYVTADGLDLKQLIQKFLLMSVAYSQGTDDYLDDDPTTPTKGLRASGLQDGANAFSTLERQIDEGWGYFGGARNYGDYTDAGLSAGPVFQDANGDNMIDLRSEYNFHASVNAAKRDNAANASAPTDFTGQAFNAFRRLRQIANETAGRTASANEFAEMQAQRDLAVDAWEKAIAATVVSYINDVLKDMETFGTGSYSFLDHAKHWSELKGFALGLQFNPRSQLNDTDFAMFHSLVGDKPVLPNDSTTNIDNYKTDLRSARELLRVAYGFDPLNIGDNVGENGW